MPTVDYHMQNTRFPVRFLGSWKVDAECFEKTWGKRKGQSIQQEYEDVFRRHDPKIADMPSSVELNAAPFPNISLLPFHKSKEEVIYISAWSKEGYFGQLTHEGIYRGFLEKREDFIKRAIREARLLAKRIDAR